MIVWIDAQLSPQLAPWLSDTFEVEAIAIRDLGHRDSEDEAIFRAAGEQGAVIMTKDRDFSELVARLGQPPQIIWITCGNTSTARMQEILRSAFPSALELLRAGEPLIEISTQKASV